MATEIRAPYNVFFGEDGYPLEGGYIYIGVSGLNPLSNPLQAYWDPTLTTPAANIRTSAGFPDHNGVIGRLYVPADYSILVQDKNGRTVYSQLEVTFEYADLLLTELRGTLSRSARAPSTFDIDDILESGLYAWTNGTTTNFPASCAAGDLFMLNVVSSPDGAGGGFVLQTITDITEGTTGANAEFRFVRYSTDAGATWSAWTVDWVGPFTVTEAVGKAFTADELNRDLVILLDNAGAEAYDITAGAARAGIRATFIQLGAGAATIEWLAGYECTLTQYTVQEFIWDGTGWRAPAVNHGRKVFGPGALAATTWRVPPGIRKIWLTGAGQGGTGANGTAATRSGAGGGSGAWCRDLELTVIDGDEYTITLDTAGASTFVGGAHNVSFGRGGDAVTITAGAGGVGAGGASNGYAGGNGANSSPRGGGGGGGVGGVGFAYNATHGGAGGGSGGAAASTVIPGPAGLGPYLSGIGGQATEATAEGAIPAGVGAGGAGGSGAGIHNGMAGGYGGGGGGGGSVTTLTGAAGGAPFLVIEW